MTLQELLTAAGIIKNETGSKKNTQSRIGLMFENIINSLFHKDQVKQVTGSSTTDVVSQKVVTDELALKFDKSSLESARSQSTTKSPTSKLVDDELNKKAIYNVTNEVPLTAGQYYTQSTAIAAVPTASRKTGLVITYATSSGVWVSEQYKGSDTSVWTTTSNWITKPNEIEQTRSQSTSKVPSSKLVDDELIKLDNTNESLGLKSMRQPGTVVSGVNSGLNSYFTDKSKLSTSKRVAFRLICPDGVINKYAIVGNSGQDFENKSDSYRFSPNKWYFVYPGPTILTASSFGAYINAVNAIGNGDFIFDIYYEYEKSIIPQELFDKNTKLGLDSMLQYGKITAGAVSGSNSYFTDRSKLSTTKRIAFRLTCAAGVVNKYAVIGTSAQDIEGLTDYYRFSPNTWYFVYPHSSILAVPFGAYVNAVNAIGTGDYQFDIYYDYETSILPSNKIGSLETDVSSLKSKNTELGFDTMRTSKTVTAGVASDSRAFTNVSNLSTLKKIAFILRCADGIINKYAFIGSTGQDIEGLTNYYRFEPNKWYYAYPHSAILTNLPMGAYIDSANAIGNGSYTFDIYYNYETSILPKESIELKNTFTGKEIFSIGDSLSTGGVWQAKFASLVGASFDNAKNNNVTYPLSIGGTGTIGNALNCGQWRARNFVNNYPSAEVLFIENINDMNFSLGSISDVPFMLSRIDDYPDQGLNNVTEANNYWTANFSAIVGAYSIQKGVCINIPFYGSGKNIKVTGVPTSNGVVYLTINGGVYGITVNTLDTIATLVAKIIEYNYGLVTDAKNNDGTSVDFYYPSGVTASFNANGTGMTVLITDTTTAQVFTPRYFIGEATSGDWNNSSKWTSTTPSVYSSCRGLIEYLQKNMPTCLLIWVIPTRYGTANGSYLRADGTRDIDAYNAANTTYENLVAAQKVLCEKYNIQYVDLHKKVGITLYNEYTYYNYSDVHPKTIGYEKWAIVMAQLLVR